MGRVDQTEQVGRAVRVGPVFREGQAVQAEQAEGNFERGTGAGDG